MNLRSDRFKPSRAGIINLWDYADEEFVFGDGRLVLRGHNGSGKTKALEVLFPFVLDGVADARRLDPFSGENRTMKSNLLYRGQEAEYGYVWMEFARTADSGNGADSRDGTGSGSGRGSGIGNGCGPESGAPHRTDADTARGPGADGVETVTLIIGLRAHRNRDGVRTSFFVTGRRLGVDFGLLTLDGRPLTENQLKTILEPGSSFSTATEYRAAVDARLFGLGRERYTQLLDLLLALRRPLLAKDLDPGKVSDTLTAGLSPIDELLVDQAARDFENLAAVQKQFDDYSVADAAVRTFLADYTEYLRTHARHRLDRIEASKAVAVEHAGTIARATAELSRATAAHEAAVEARQQADTERQALERRLAALREHDAYRAQHDIELQRRQIARTQEEIVKERARLAAGAEHLAALEREADELAERLERGRSTIDTLATHLADAAERAGIAFDGDGPADTGADLAVTSRARSTARRDDIAEVRTHLRQMRDAEHDRQRAESDLHTAEEALTEAEGRCEEAGRDLAKARRATRDDLRRWAERWTSADEPVATPDDAEALTEAVERLGEPGAPTLVEIFTARSDARRLEIAARAERLAARVSAIDADLDRLARERAAIAAERDDAPPTNDLRIADRDGRPGAPLWRLVRFGDDVDPARAASIEGALYGAGLLTAWLHPDPALTEAAVRAGEADGYLIAAPEDHRPAGPTLADVLVPEDQDLVPAEVITAVLRSIRLADDLLPPPHDAAPAPATTGHVADPSGQVATPSASAMTSQGALAADRIAASAAPVSAVSHQDVVSAGQNGGRAGQVPGSAGRNALPTALVPVVTVRAQFGYGVYVGARPKPAPEFIGATNRANRRRARLSEYDELLAGLRAEREIAEEESALVAALVKDFRRAQDELPATQPVSRAVRAVEHHATLLAAARETRARHARTLDSAVAEVDARRRRLRQAAAERNMPTAPDDVDAVARAVDDFDQTAQRLDAERRQITITEKDAAARQAAIARQRGQHADDSEALRVKEAEHKASVEEFEAREQSLDAPLKEVLAQIEGIETRLKAVRAAYRDADGRASTEHDNVITARSDLKHGRTSLAEALDHLYEHIAAFAPYAHRDLRPMLGVTAAAPWPAELGRPDPEQIMAPVRAAASERSPGRASTDDRAADPAAKTDAREPNGGPGVAGAAEGGGAAGQGGAASGVGDHAGPAGGAIDPDTAVRAALPEGVAELLDAFREALSGVRVVGESALKSVSGQMSAALRAFQEALDGCGEDYRVDHDPGATGVVMVWVNDEGGRNPVAAFARRIADRVQEQGVLLEERERTVLEDELLTGLAQQIHDRVLAAKDLVVGMNQDTRSRRMSSGTAIGIRWGRSDRMTDRQRAASQLLERDAHGLGPSGLAELRGLLREMIRDYRATHPRATYRQALADVLDYRTWYTFELRLAVPGEPEVKLTKAKHEEMSGGEKSAAIHLPLFAAANALYSSAKPTCPRLIALDEAFAGIDDRYKPELLGLTVKFDLDLFMTGHDLWVHFDTVPMAAHYDLHHDKSAHAVSAMLMLWDGTQTIDADAGFAGNDDLATLLLGIAPTRHAPLSADDTLLSAMAAAEPIPEETGSEEVDATA
ncbi:SbcC/MukB-like Walker B domain-containing protein [Thermopolyspora sp. NPDC052614]|uniref:SbcC/MukB-like Walker B domain-containing protein n=1 Tax=Thermopolyspora sp. NPDC052614 TaxID=3155682 RepID=UPI003441996B